MAYYKYPYTIFFVSFLQKQRLTTENEKPIQKSESQANNVGATTKKSESPTKLLVSDVLFIFWLACVIE